MNENVFDKNDIKKLMRDMRKKSNKTKEQIAEELGVSRQTISNWESGKSQPDAVSLIKFAKSYDPSLSDLKKLLSQDESEEVVYDGQRLLFETYRERADAYFAKSFGMVDFDVDSFYKEVCKENSGAKNNFDNIPSHDQKGNLIVLDKARQMLPLLTILAQNKNRHIEERIDFPYIFTTLILRLKAKGYDIRETSMPSGGYIRLFILNDGKNQHLGSIILEHLLVDDCRLEGLTAAERTLLKGIYAEYEDINKKADSLNKKLYPTISEIGDEIYRNIGEYTLLLGYNQGNKEICALDIIYTSNTPEELSEYITSHAKELKPLADNKDSFLVIGDHHDCDFTFTANSGPKELPGTGLKFYRVDCTPSDKEPENE